MVRFFIHYMGPYLFQKGLETFGGLKILLLQKKPRQAGICFVVVYYCYMCPHFLFYLPNTLLHLLIQVMKESGLFVCLFFIQAYRH